MELGTPPSVRVDLRIYPHDEGVGIAPDPPISFAATTSSVVTSVSGTVPARWTETCMLPVSAPLPSAFYMNGVSGRSAKENERGRGNENMGWGTNSTNVDGGVRRCLVRGCGWGTGGE